MTLREQFEELNGLREQMKSHIRMMRTKQGGASEDDRAELHRREAELAEKTKSYNEAYRLEEIELKASEPLSAPQPFGRVPLGGGGEPQNQGKYKSIGEAFVKSAAYKQMIDSGSLERGDFKAEISDMDLKSTLHTSTGVSAGFPFVSDRSGDVVHSAQRMPFVHEIVGQGSTNSGSVDWFLQTVFTNNAAETAEGSTKPDGVLTWTLQNTVVRTIAVWIPVTSQQLWDVPFVEGLINSDLSLMLDQRLEQQILTGDGNAPNLTGILNTGSVQTQALGSDVISDAVLRAMNKVETTGRAVVDYALFHNNDWLDIRLEKDATGNYIWGPPSVPGPMTIWGVPALKSTAETENTGLVGAFGAYSKLYRRMGTDISVGTINDDFVKNQRVILAECRVAFTVTRPTAFCKVTGI